MGVITLQEALDSMHKAARVCGGKDAIESSR